MQMGIKKGKISYLLYPNVISRGLTSNQLVPFWCQARVAIRLVRHLLRQGQPVQKTIEK